jgi:hypothetical protein
VGSQGAVGPILAAAAAGVQGSVRGFNLQNTGMPNEVLFGGFYPQGTSYTGGLSVSS